MKEKNKTKIQVLKRDSIGLNVLYVVISIVYVYRFVSFYNISYDSSTDMWGLIWKELGNSFTIASGLLVVLAYFFSRKNKHLNNGLRAYLACSIFILYCFGACASAIDLSVNVVLVIHFLFYVISVVVLICFNKEVHVVDKSAMRNALNTITNKKILSVQVFSVETIKEGEYVKYEFKSLESMSRDKCNVNGILSAQYRIKSSYVTGLELVQLLYERVVENGEPNEINQLLDEIEKNKHELLEELVKIVSPDHVTEEDCCIARLYVLYLTLENILKNSTCTGIRIYDGILGLSNLEIERRLFSLVRTGILGGILLESNKIYTFDYHRNGKKVGRKYASFVVGTLSKNKKLLCLTVIREDDKEFISGDALKAVYGVEKNILNALA